MKKLFCRPGDAQILEDAVCIKKYPFRPSRIFPDQCFLAKEIDAIGLQFGILKVMTRGDVIFISAERKNELESFAKRNKIVLVENSWNWDWILEPYLDTEYTDETNTLLLKRLSENGISADEVDRIRKEVGRQMYRYNFYTMLWEWQSLGLFDVLSAMQAKYNKRNFENFYWRAIDIEKRGMKWG